MSDMTDELADKAKRLLKAELKRADVTYEELARRLSDMGIKESKATVANKISRGMFSAVFLIAAMKAIGRETVSWSDM